MNPEHPSSHVGEAVARLSDRPDAVEHVVEPGR